MLHTCKIVSKLNVKPFHNVNSPELAPVINLRPSGVHATVNTGHLILFVAVKHQYCIKFRNSLIGGKRNDISLSQKVKDLI